MRIILGVAFAVALMCTVPQNTFADATVSGDVDTCPSGDPLPAIVHIWVNGSLYGTTTANSSGYYSTQVTLPDCESQSAWITVTLGSSLYTTYTSDHCPNGKGGAGPSCCVQRAEHVAGCSPNVTMDVLQFRCGIPGAPPCPSE